MSANRIADKMAAAVGPMCAREKCTNLAVYMPVLQFRVNEQHEPAEMSFGMGLCPDCREKHGRVEDFLTDESFALACRALALYGKQTPTRSLTTIRWHELPAGRA